ncbi:MAG: glycosyltransferase [Haliea sp.]
MNDTDHNSVHVTFILLAFNQETFIEQACLSALSQTYENIDFIFSDDRSSDRTFELMQSVISKRNTASRSVEVRQNPENIGLIDHINLLCELATGELIVVAAGDDISIPSRTEQLVDAYLKSGRKANSIHSSVIMVDETGKELGLLEPRIIKENMNLADISLSTQLLIGATHAWTKDIFERFGPIKEKGSYEDLVIAFRSALLGPISYVSTPLVYYRVGSGMSAYKKLPKNFAGAVGTRLKSANVVAAVYGQRLHDAHKIGRADMIELETAFIKTKIKMELYSGYYLDAIKLLNWQPTVLAIFAKTAAVIFFTKIRFLITD